MKRKRRNKILLITASVFLLVSSLAFFTDRAYFRKEGSIVDLSVTVEETDDLLLTDSDGSSDVTYVNNGIEINNDLIINPGEIYSKTYSIKPKADEFKFNKIKLSMSNPTIEAQNAEGNTYQSIVNLIEADRALGDSSANAKEGIDGTVSRVILLNSDNTEIAVLLPGESIEVNVDRVNGNELKLVEVVYLGVAFEDHLEEVKHSYSMSFINDGSDN